MRLWRAPISADVRRPSLRSRAPPGTGLRTGLGVTGYATFDATEIRAMHYLMLSHDHPKSPGRYRKGPIYVHDERNRVVYEGPGRCRGPQAGGRSRRQPAYRGE